MDKWLMLGVRTSDKEYKKYSKKRQMTSDKKLNAFDILITKTKKIRQPKNPSQNKSHKSQETK